MSSTSPPPDRNNDRRALLSAYKDVVQSEADRGKQVAVQESGPGARTILLMLLTAGLVVALAFHDRWLDPIKTAPESREVREASLRLVMARQIHGIDAWRRAHNGELPDSATAARTTLSPFNYEIVGVNWYRLTGKNGDITLTYSSTDSLNTFLGNSYEVIRHRGRP
jgi:hypothetical protein